MTRVSVVLLLAVIASALYLVRTQYEARKLYTELDRAVALSRQLASDQQRLQVERRAQATPARVQQLARERLQMRAATAAITQYVSDDGAPVVRHAPAPAAAAGGTP